MSQLTCTLPLPETFRPGDILSFHRRDPQEIAERVTENALRKGLVWADLPACLTVNFHARQAEAELAVDGSLPPGRQTALETMLRRMLGLSQPVEKFERAYRSHPQVGPLIARQPGLRVPAAATPFEALTWAIASQQISVGAAVSLRRKLILAAGVRHSAGLCCSPEARQIVRLSEENLRQAGFSTSKARRLHTVSRQVVENELPLDEWSGSQPVDEIRDRLLAIRGIGPWTVDYALLRGFGWLDGSLHGDAAVRRGLQALLGSSDGIGEEQARTWLAGFSPWRALVAAHLWAMQSAAAY